VKFRIETLTDGQPNPHCPWEDYEKDEVTDLESAKRWARETVDYFNATLRPHEKPRTLGRVKLVKQARGSSQSTKDHAWEKTNLVTVVKGSQAWDEYECSRCGVTAKLHGIGGPIVLDPDYRRAKVYRRCDTAKAHLDKVWWNKARTEA